AQAKDLALKMEYRGGVRVFLNGQEVGRGSLPDGELAANVPGAPYPEEAYRALPDEIPDQTTGRYHIYDIRSRFAQGLRSADPRLGKFRGVTPSGHWINQKGWDRIKALRDRQLGPIKVPASLL